MIDTQKHDNTFGKQISRNKTKRQGKEQYPCSDSFIKEKKIINFSSIKKLI